MADAPLRRAFQTVFLTCSTKDRAIVGLALGGVVALAIALRVTGGKVGALFAVLGVIRFQSPVAGALWAFHVLWMWLVL
jgi:S-formylglutathione hydrolase FrmB